MKKVLVLIVLVAIVGGWYMWHKKSGNSTPDVKVATTVSKPDPSDATFNFEDGPITLKDGKATTALAPGSAAEMDTELGEQIAYGDINADGKNDTVTTLVQSGGGSGVFIYVAAYVSGNVAYKGSNAVLLGDRITPQSIDIANSIITVKFLDRKPNEPFSAEPTISTTQQFVFKDGQLAEK